MNKLCGQLRDKLWATPSNQLWKRTYQLNTLGARLEDQLGIRLMEQQLGRGLLNQLNRQILEAS